MKLELTTYNTVCETKSFVINGVKASYKDFGEKYDSSMDNSKPFYCGSMVFLPKESTQPVLDKYHISVDEYAYICRRLKDVLSFGLCRLCG